jgi:hypothetical protein
VSPLVFMCSLVYLLNSDVSSNNISYSIVIGWLYVLVCFIFNFIVFFMYGIILFRADLKLFIGS